MYDDEFNPIWKNIVQPHIKEISQRLGVKYKHLFFTRFMLEHKYNKYKDVLVKTYMRLDTTNIDRHKIASCILKAILATKPLYIPAKEKCKVVLLGKECYEVLNCETTFQIRNSDNDEQRDNLIKKYQKELIFQNEYLALSIVISIMDSYINSDNRDNRFKHNMVLPEPFPEIDVDYLLDVCIGLHYSSIRKFNPITFANALFLWEKYSCRKTQCDNLTEAYKQTLKKIGRLDEDIEEILTKAKFGTLSEGDL